MGLDPGLQSAMKARAWRARAQSATKVALIPGPSDRPVVVSIQALAFSVAVGDRWSRFGGGRGAGAVAVRGLRDDQRL